MRGKRSISALIQLTFRITPADAGKTRWRCKEHHCRQGSPPRMRGKLNTSFKRHSRDRITPADAGKTKTNQRTVNHDEDHPRGCGENHKLTVMCSDGKGSPPRMRGKLSVVINPSGYRGITPADAGKTCNSGCNSGCG